MLDEKSSIVANLEEEIALLRSAFEKDMSAKQEAVEHAQLRSSDLEQQMELLHQQLEKVSLLRI